MLVRSLCVSAAVVLTGLTAAATIAAASGSPRDAAVGSGANEFAIIVGEARLSVSAHSGPAGESPTGHVRAKGDPDGDGPAEPFKLEGEVTCLRVSGDRAAIKYRFKHAEGSAAPFEGGGVQIFLEDNGVPRGGEAVDATAFDPPQAAGQFQPMESVCDDPDARGYDQIQSGNFTVRDAQP